MLCFNCLNWFRQTPLRLESPYSTSDGRSRSRLCCCISQEEKGRSNKNPHLASARRLWPYILEIWWLSCGCLESVRRASGGVDVWMVSLGCLAGRCLQGVWMVSGGYLWSVQMVCAVSRTWTGTKLGKNEVSDHWERRRRWCHNFEYSDYKTRSVQLNWNWGCAWQKWSWGYYLSRKES